MKRTLTIILMIALVGCSSSKKNAEASAAPEVPSNVEALADDHVATEEPENTPPESTDEAVWQQRDPMMLPDQEMRIQVSEFDAYYCDFSEVTRPLGPEATEVMLPTLTGMVTFSIENSNTMSPALAAKFPTIRSFKGKSKDGKLTLRLDTNDEGLFAEITGTERKELIAPLFKGSPSYYAVYAEENSEGGTPRDETYD